MTSARVGGDFPFKVSLTGYSGHLRFEPLPPVYRETSLSSLPNLILPPPVPPETSETLLKNIEDQYLLPSLDEEIHSVAEDGRFWDFDWYGEGSRFMEPCMPRFGVMPVWEPPYRRGEKAQAKKISAHIPDVGLNGTSMHPQDVLDWIPEFEQVKIGSSSAAAHNSSSVQRKPGPPDEFVRGSTSNHPFRPGGFEVASASERHVPEGSVSGEWLCEVLEGGMFQTVPPGFKYGMDFGVAKPLRTPPDLSVAEGHQGAIESFLPALDAGKADAKCADRGQVGESSLVLLVDGEIEEDGMVKKQEQNGLILPGDAIVEGADEEDDLLQEVVGVTKSVSEAMDEVKKIIEQPKTEVWAVMDREEGVSEKFRDLVPDMAITFPFQLDVFQKEAIYHLERNQSVFVAAHTSAGKTVVAEYAFALAAKHCTRAVYTSPIKTISNQKYRDFSAKFDVGLLTGDVSIRPDASCLIMTTEILRSMLYKGADIVRDIEWVIFDEVHYVNDAERGVVWEEVIIMLPDHVNMVLLSATVPNIFDFADWIGRTKRKKIYVTGTTRRPVPLEHCLYYSGELYKICEEETFLTSGVKEAKEAHYAKTVIKPAGGFRGVPPPGGGNAPLARGGAASGRGGPAPGRAPQGRGRGPAKTGAGGQAQKMVQAAAGANLSGWRSETSQWYSLINKLSKKNLLPVVVFCFSKNRCDQSADSLNATDLTSGSEKSEIRVFCDKSFSRLKGTDRKLPQVVRVEELLRRGIGVHHAGLLPIVKEVVEMLFCRGVIKVLFSTETFAMGVNAPARTVAFHSLRKHDGRSFRQLLPGEYTQMAGRAGRRGLDKVGTVLVMCWEEIPEEGDLRRLLTGKPTKLESQFRLTYTMILNLLRVEDLKVEDMLKRSFAEFHAQRSLPEQQKQLLEREGALSRMNETIECILGEPTIEDYYNLAYESEKIGEQIQDTMMQSRAVQQSLAPGRVVLICNSIVPVPSLGVVVRPSTATNRQAIVLSLYRGPPPTTPTSSVSTQPVLLSNASEEGYFISRKDSRSFDDEYAVKGRASKKTSGAIQVTLPYYGTSSGMTFVVMEVENKGFVNICANKIRIDGSGLLEDVSAAAYAATVQELLQLEVEYERQSPPSLDPVKDLKLNDLDVVEKYRKRQSILEKMSRNQCHGCPKLQEHYALVKNQHMLKERVRQLKYELSDAALQQMPDFQQRIEVLQEVGCIDADLVVQLKGRVACEINSGDELIATECLFDNELDDLNPAETVALLSSLVFQQNDASEPVLTERLALAKERLYNTAFRLGDIQASFGLPINAEDYARNSLKFGLMEVVYEWAKGTPFSDICELTNVPEGSIVRAIVRLDEICREFKDAARLIGNSALFEKMDEASAAIKRDIVFAASLYVTGVS